MKLPFGLAQILRASASPREDLTKAAFLQIRRTWRQQDYLAQRRRGAEKIYLHLVFLDFGH
jgi:hypothetical protein